MADNFEFLKEMSEKVFLELVCFVCSDCCKNRRIVRVVAFI